MIWGLSFALHEEAIHDRRTGRPMNADLAGYHIPVNADIPEMEALLIDEDDPYVNALGIKGVGEIGITGTVGAIANAIWHATGVQGAPLPDPDRGSDLLGRPAYRLQTRPRSFRNGTFGEIRKSDHGTARKVSSRKDFGSCLPPCVRASARRAKACGQATAGWTSRS